MKPQRTRSKGKGLAKVFTGDPDSKGVFSARIKQMERKSAAFSKWAVRKDVTWRKTVRQVRGIRRRKAGRSVRKDRTSRSGRQRQGKCN